MDIKTICLGLLVAGEACGYELKKRFEELFSHFLSASYGSIYPALADLAAEGLVNCREVPQEGRPDRRGEPSWRGRSHTKHSSRTEVADVGTGRQRHRHLTSGRARAGWPQI